MINGLYSLFYQVQSSDQINYSINGLYSLPARNSHHNTILLNCKIGGYRSSRIRALVWPKLLGIDSQDLSMHYSTYLHSNTSVNQLETLENSSSSSINANSDSTGHRDLPQVCCDVERSLHSIYQVKHWTDEQRNERRQVLTDIIIAVLNKNGDRLYYYQV